MLAFSVLGAQAVIVDGPELVAEGSLWQYLDDGSDQGTTWREPTFDDSTWKSGPAELGYGDLDEATTVGFGGDPDNKFITTYFRHTFLVADPAAIDALMLSVIRDDGAAVYLNGYEIFRDGLVADAAFDDTATEFRGGSSEYLPVVTELSTGALPPEALVAGANVLAAEVHQASANDYDMSFELSLRLAPALQFVVEFSGPVSAATLDASDLIVDGNLSATEATLVDADTVHFELPGLGPGAHSLAIDAGSITSFAGEPIEAFAQPLAIAADSQYRVQHPPHVQLGNAPLVGFAGSDLDQIDLLWKTVSDGAGTDDSFDVEFRFAGSTDAWTAAGPVVEEFTGMYASTILGLQWDTDYEYRVLHRRGDVIIKIYQHTFHTRLPAGDHSPFSFVGWGDSYYGSAPRLVQARINRVDPAFALQLGDARPRLDPTSDPEGAAWAAGHVNYLTWGNHDYSSMAEDYSLPVPEAGVNAHAEPPESQQLEHNYSWDHGDVHFVTFDSNYYRTIDDLDGLLDYVVADLEASSARWKVVFGHHPVAGAPDKLESPADYYYQQVVSRLVGAGADLFLVGHSHMFHWTYPLTGQTNGIAEFASGPYNAFEEGQGLVQVVSGAGGASLRSGNYDQFPFVARGFSLSTPVPMELGFAQIDVTASQLTVSYIAADDGAVIDSFTITGTTEVVAMEASSSGAAVRFSGPLDFDQLNLYRGSSRGHSPADITLVGDQTGPVVGSLVWDAATDELRFIKTGAPLAADSYTLTLESRLDGIVDSVGNRLDGDADGTPGGDFVARFTVDAVGQRTLSLPDIVRGPGQTIDLKDSGGIPLSIDAADGVTDVSMTLQYDPNVLVVSGGVPAPGLPLDWQIGVDTSTPGMAVITASGSALPAGPLDLAVLAADVSSTAAYGQSQVLALSGVSLNGGALAARGDEALLCTTYIGDVTGNGGYSGLDAAHIARVAGGLDSGFDHFPVTDPKLMGDTTHDGALSWADASTVARKTVGLPQNEIPGIPSPTPSRAALAAENPAADSTASVPARASLGGVIDSRGGVTVDSPPYFVGVPLMAEPLSLDDWILTTVTHTPSTRSISVDEVLAAPPGLFLEHRGVKATTDGPSEGSLLADTIRDRLFASVGDWVSDDGTRCGLL